MTVIVFHFTIFQTSQNAVSEKWYWSILMYHIDEELHASKKLEYTRVLKPVHWFTVDEFLSILHSTILNLWLEHIQWWVIEQFIQDYSLLACDAMLMGTNIF
jgi:hypothetical protein